MEIRPMGNERDVFKYKVDLNVPFVVCMFTLILLTSQISVM